jgi:hypothetical protein
LARVLPRAHPRVQDRAVRTYLVAAPAWFVTAVQAALWTASMATWFVIDGQRAWPAALVSSAAGGAVFGVLLWFGGRPQRERQHAIVGGLTTQQRRAVLTAARTGVPPGDPALRPAAAAVVRDRLTTKRRYRPLGTVVLGAVAAGTVVAAAAGSPWYLVGTAATVCALV